MEDGRVAQILSLLLDSGEFVAYERLAQKLGTSRATIVRTVRRVASDVAQFGLCLNRKRGMGIKLTGSPDSLAGLRGFLKEARFSHQYSIADRKALVLLHMFADQSGTKLLSLSHSLALSESSISKCMSDIAEEMASAGLTIDRRPGIGTTLLGHERVLCSVAFRSMMSVIDRNGFLSALLYRLGRTTEPPSDFGSTTNKLFVLMDHTVSIEALATAVEEIESTVGRPMSDSTYLSCCVFLWLVGLRGYSLDRAETEELRPEAAHFFSILEPVVASRPANWQCNVIWGAVAALTALDAPRVSDSYRTLASRVIRLVEGRLDVTVYPQKEVTQLLALYIASLESQLRHGILLVGAFPSHEDPADQREQPLLSEIVDLLTFKLGIVWSPKHVRSLLEPIRPALTERLRTVRTVVVCAAGVGTSFFLSKTISDRVIGVEVVDVVSVRSVTDEFLHRNRIELIISTVEATFTGVATVRIWLPLNDTEITKIRQTAQAIRRDLQQDNETHAIAERARSCGAGPHVVLREHFGGTDG